MDSLRLLEHLLVTFKVWFPQFGKTALKRIILNYIDLIVPAGEQTLADLVTAETPRP